MSEIREKKAKTVDLMLADFSSKRETIKRRLQLMPNMPQCMPDECRTLWYQVVLCFMFQFDYAALATSGAFVEALLERAIPQFRALQGKSAKPTPEGLSNRINVAKSIGLITDEEATTLHYFRNLVRNPFAHGNIERLANLYSQVKGATFVVVQDGKVESVNALGKDDVERISKATVKPRAKLSARKIAAQVLYHIGGWGAECATKAWPPVSR
jgi:hypothetical protein